MRRHIGASLLLLLVTAGVGGAAAQSTGNPAKASGMETDVSNIKQALLGNWESIAPEVRPSASKGPDGSLKPFYLKRTFKYLPSDRFELEIVGSGPLNSVPPSMRAMPGSLESSWVNVTLPGVPSTAALLSV